MFKSIRREKMKFQIKNIERTSIGFTLLATYSASFGIFAPSTSIPSPKSGNIFSVAAGRWD
jgi:hypothetical protein